MNRKISKRRVRKRRGTKGNSKMKFFAVVVIMIMAVLLGYLTAKFVIGPILGYNADESHITSGLQSASKENDDKEKDDKDDSDTIEKGYALQFGVYSTKEAANNMMYELRSKGIDAKVIEEDDMYKVISPVIKTKKQALDKLEDIKNSEIEDVFITSF